MRGCLLLRVNRKNAFYGINSAHCADFDQQRRRLLSVLGHAHAVGFVPWVML
jgi:hypothetical protein